MAFMGSKVTSIFARAMGLYPLLRLRNQNFWKKLYPLPLYG